MSFSQTQLLNLLVSKFPNVYFSGITQDKNVVTILTARFYEKEKFIKHYRFLSNGDRGRIMLFLEQLKMPIIFEIIEVDTEGRPDLRKMEVYNSVQYIYAAGFDKKNSKPYTERDEALWFDNIDKIFEGKFNKENIFFYDSTEYCCYVDYSIFPNIDLRNHLLLFQTVFITLPFEKSIHAWLKENKINEKELLELINRKRIKIILTQPESRYDTAFLDKVYEISPASLITRRAIATLQQVDIVQTADSYLLSDAKIIPELLEFTKVISTIINLNPEFLYELIVWPLKAKRKSFEYLHASGLLGVANFGVNKAIEMSLADTYKKELSFEFFANAPSIHLSNSLNAVYFPFKTDNGYSDIYYASCMSELLNLYKNLTSRNAKSFIENKQNVNNGILPINPIDIIEMNNYISITELEIILSKDVVFPAGKKLMESLAALNDEDRKIKIQKYNDEIEKIVGRKNKHQGVIDLGSNIIVDGVTAFSGFSVLGSAISLLKLSGKSFAKSISAIRNTLSKIEETIYNNEDKGNIHFLSKINRVAKIIRP